MGPPTIRPAYWLLWLVGGLAGYVAAFWVLRRRNALDWKTGAAVVIAAHGLWLGARWHQRLEYLPVLEALAVTPADMLKPGMRIPLGLLTGAVLAGAWCLLVRAPWRETGDALAVAASVMIPIGRIGCFLNGCCMGVPCEHGGLFCLRYPPGTESYDIQVVRGLLPAGSAASLPAHPLPLYFAVASVLTLLVLLWLLRRGARAGSLLAVFCVVRPTTKLLLEPLRASAPGAPDGLMLLVPVSVLVATAAFFIAAAWRARRASRIGGQAGSALADSRQ